MTSKPSQNRSVYSLREDENISRLLPRPVLYLNLERALHCLNEIISFFHFDGKIARCLQAFGGGNVYID